MVDYGGEQYEASARIVAAHPYFRDSAAATTSMIVRGLWLGLGGWLSGLILFRQAVARRRELALRDRFIAGTRVTTEERLPKLTRREAGDRALAIGAVTLPRCLETPHMAMIGPTGSGQTHYHPQQIEGTAAGRGAAADRKK